MPPAFRRFLARSAVCLLIFSAILIGEDPRLDIAGIKMRAAERLVPLKPGDSSGVEMLESAPYYRAHLRHTEGPGVEVRSVSPGQGHPPLEPESN
jgi:hypothetical protein